MNGDFVDPKDFGFEDVEAARKHLATVTDEEFDSVCEFYTKHELPQGLECINIHLHPNVHEWMHELLEERGLPHEDHMRCFHLALALDSMIS